MSGAAPAITALVPPVRTGVVGLGKGYGHAAAYHDDRRTCLAALCDIDAARLAATAARLESRHTFADPHELFRSGKVDVVSIATPNATHYELTLAALEAGLHVLCEKPLALDAGQAREMAAAAAAAGRVLMVNYNYRFVPASQALKAAAGTLGEVYFARSVWHRSRGIPGPHRGRKNWYVERDMAGGGSLIDLGVHRLDLALWLMDFPAVAAVTGATYAALGRAYAARTASSFDVEDFAVGFVRFVNGASLVLEASWALNQPYAELMETWVYGTAGGMVQRNTAVSNQFEAELYREDAAGAFHATRLRPGPDQQRTVQEEFIDSVIAGRSPSAPAEHAVIAMQVIDALYESAAGGHEVNIT